MGTFYTYIAVFKAYMAINILLTPRAFVNGGYILSPFALAIAFTIEAFSSVRLMNVALDTGIYSYPLLMRHALGDKGFLISHICLALAHWQFTVGHITFAIESLQSTLKMWMPSG